MLIGVISDTHGSTASIDMALRKLPNADAWLHLGDNVRDAEYIRAMGQKVCFVRGNCDYSDAEPEQVEAFEGVRVFMTHGHQYAVNYDRSRLAYRAEELMCNVALYGHTHVSLIEASGGLLIVNPGSPSRPRNGRKPSFASLSIDGSDVSSRIILLNQP